MPSKHSHRKDEHVSLAEKFYNPSEDFFKSLRFVDFGLPKIGINDVDISTKIGGLQLNIPFYIEAISGGSETTKKINYRLAKIAAKTGLAMAVGSQSVGINEPQTADSFKIVRKTNPAGIIFANIGADKNPSQAQKAINMIEADALEIHVNPAQELIMPEGSRNFDFLNNIKAIKQNVSVPVIVKQVGFGMNSETMDQLRQSGISIVNISGVGGTNFAKIENFRRPNKDMNYLKNWGLTTPESLLESQKFLKSFEIIASGGITNPLDMAKCLSLGASACGMAGKFLHLIYHNSDEEIIDLVNNWIYGLKAIMVMLNCLNLKSLKKHKLLLSQNLKNFVNQRNIEY